MSFYHIILELNDHISSLEESRDLEIFNIEDITPYIHSMFLPYMNQQMIELEDENILYADILHFEVQHTSMPIEFLVEEEQKELPSDTEVTISAKEIFNDHDLSKNVTAVIFDLLHAVKIEH
ncbi:hypothetical protein [Acinetobacter boissieri]|uniref:Uncharacterized protein n=1 Tax=Acinetobacter boissieri TaxID=1219383 RepID=A0A1G6K2K3_9GAMM|nr:hypothetical protein [Acinetobacter boissieri]SDC25163.1 hypothetical protein SAMN05421733_1145 [Acinetobacter boissieri]